MAANKTGRRQSPFIGKRVPEVENGVPILYPRYVRLSDVVEGGPAGMAVESGQGIKRRAEQQPAVDANDKEAQQAGKKAKKSKKQKRAEADEVVADAGDAGPPSGQLPPAGKHAANGVTKEGGAQPGGVKDGQQQQQSPQVQPAGNAQEAAKIRSVLGFSGAATSSTPGFSFAFSGEQPQQEGGQAGPSGEGQQAGAEAGAEGGADAQPRKQTNKERKAAAKAAAASAAAAVQTAAEAEAEAKVARLLLLDSAKDGYLPRRVYVGGMPYAYDEEAIREYWSYCGPIESLDMLTFPDSGRFRGICFITFETEEGYKAALECNGEQLDGQTLKVDKCKAASLPRRPAGAPASRVGAHVSGSKAGGAAGQAAGGGAAAKTPGYNVAYVGNIAFEATLEELQELLPGATRVRLHTDKDTGKSKGYAHVHFADEDSLDRAVAMSGAMLHGRPLRVGYGQLKRA